jgi:hypothetical protein
MSDPDTYSPIEIIAILRHLRWGYARHGLMWWIAGAGFIFFEPRAAAWGDTFVWICSWAGWGAGMWGTLAFAMAMFRSDKWLLEDFIRQASLEGMKKSPKEEKNEPMPTSLNRRLDEMGPRYRAIFGKLTRVLAMIENAASKKPPNMTSRQFETAIDHLESSTAELKEAARIRSGAQCLGGCRPCAMLGFDADPEAPPLSISFRQFGQRVRNCSSIV